MKINIQKIKITSLTRKTRSVNCNQLNHVSDVLILHSDSIEDLGVSHIVNHVSMWGGFCIFLTTKDIRAYTLYYT